MSSALALAFALLLLLTLPRTGECQPARTPTVRARCALAHRASWPHPEPPLRAPLAGADSEP